MKIKQAPAESFQDVIAWQRAHEFVLNIYRHIEAFRKSELYGLTSQFRRAAISNPANVAEGFKNAGRSDKLRFLNIAQGSLEECRYSLILSKDLGHADCAEAWPILEETNRLIQGHAGAIRRQLVGKAVGVFAGLGTIASAFCFLFSVS